MSDRYGNGLGQVNLEWFSKDVAAALVGRTLVLEIEMEVPSSQFHDHPCIEVACDAVDGKHYRKQLIKARIADVKT